MKKQESPGGVSRGEQVKPHSSHCRTRGEVGVLVAATVGLPKTALKQPQLVHLLSGLRFHAHSWPDGRTDNPRLCRACRLARGCHCWSCDWERRGQR